MILEIMMMIIIKMDKDKVEVPTGSAGENQLLGKRADLPN